MNGTAPLPLPRTPALRASLALTASAACWGLATVATKGLLARVPPLTVLTVQLLASVAFLWAAVWATRAPLRLDRGAALASLSGLLEPGLAYTVGLVGLTLTTASSASLIGAAETPMIMVLAWLFLGEPLGGRTLLLAALAGAGVGLLMLPDVAALDGGSLRGDSWIVLATFLAAVYVVLSRRLVTGIAPLPLAALQQTVGLLWALAALALGRALGLGEAAEAEVPVAILVLVGASGIVQYALTFWLYLAGLRYVPAGQAAVFLSLIPVFGVGGAALALGERLAPLQWLGAAVIVGAVQAMVRAEQVPTKPSRQGATGS